MDIRFIWYAELLMNGIFGHFVFRFWASGNEQRPKTSAKLALALACLVEEIGIPNSVLPMLFPLRIRLLVLRDEALLRDVQVWSPTFGRIAYAKSPARIPIRLCRSASWSERCKFLSGCVNASTETSVHRDWNFHATSNGSPTKAAYFFTFVMYAGVHDRRGFLLVFTSISTV